MTEKKASINNIRINDWLWLTLQKHLISIRWKGLPTDVHFTIAFNENSPHINVHLTKNIGGLPIDDKPKIEILKITKADLNEVLPHIIPAIISKFITPFDLDQFLKESSNEIRFIPYESFDEHATSEKSETLFIEAFKGISKVEKRTRLKVEGDIENKLIELSNSDSLLEIINDTTVAMSDKDIKTTGGLLRIGEDQMLPLIKIEDKWFKLNPDVKPMDILKAIIPEPLAVYLKKYTKYSLVNIRKALTKKDVEKFNHPITLYKVIPK